MQINKLILVPLLAAIASFIKASTGYEIDDHKVDMAANIILGIVTIIGVWMNRHKKAKKSEVQTNAEHPDFSDSY